uniref:Uncharacterized protein n=1 Tax=viral metagenome TaxID=1070528 RepID=A0A6C0KMZ6_9ZZZZ
MTLSGPQRYQYDQIRRDIEKTLKDTNVSNTLYHSTDGIVRVVDAILQGDDWASQVVNENGHPLFTPNEQQRFTNVFRDHVEGIRSFFGKEAKEAREAKEAQEGGAYVPDSSTLSGLSKDFLDTKTKQATNSSSSTEKDGMDDIYTMFMDRMQSMDQFVNEYASKHGVLKLEKEHDLQPDIRLIPEPVAQAISAGVTAIKLPISPEDTMYVLSKFKIPYRTVVSIVYLALDVVRLSMGTTDRDTGRKMLSILLSILEVLRGDWKKATLTFMGYFGKMPMLYGQMGKIFLTAFRMFSPQLQESFIFGSLDATKSFLIGTLLAIFQITAPEEVRLPLIAALEKVAIRKAEIDGKLVEVGLSARPDYLSPTFQDLNNIQAVLSDKAYVCSCEFENLVKAVDQSSAIRIVLQLLRIPVTKEFRDLQCGDQPCKPFVSELVETVTNPDNTATTATTDKSMEQLEPLEPLEPVETKETKEPTDTTEPTETTETNNTAKPVEPVEPVEPAPISNNKLKNRIKTGGRKLHARIQHPRKEYLTRQSCFF